MIRIYADFNSQDEEGRVWLTGPQTKSDMKPYEEHFTEGMRVLLYEDNDFEVESILTFDLAWRGIPDDSTLRYLD